MAVDIILSAKISFVTFIRNEVKKTTIHHKIECFVTNPDTNFWLILVILKVTNGGIIHEGI